MSNPIHTYQRTTFESTAKPEMIAAYSWTVPDAKAAVFVLHGFRSHTEFNYLRNDSPTRLHIYGDGETDTDSSLIRELNLRGLSVYGHDHVGHGRSTGLRAYFPTFRTLVEDLLTHIRTIDKRDGLTTNNKPIFLIGHSLGGTVAIIAARDYPQMFAGIATSSAATEPPANMFGIVGRIQSALSGITSILIPTAELVTMPKSLDADLQAVFDSDPLNTSCGIRARVGREILNTYANISETAHTIITPFLSSSGELDTIVNPQAAKRFFENASSTDKTYIPAKGRWHNMFGEAGREEIWSTYSDWIDNRTSTDKVNQV